MNKKFTLFCLLAIGSVSYSLSAQSFDRIISLSPSLTKSLCYLGAEDRLVGYTSYCTLSHKEEEHVVASAILVNVEKVVSLRPDLVVATSITNPETLLLLKNMGIRTELFRDPESFEGICTQFIEIGRLIGKEREAVEIVSQSRAKVKSLTQTQVEGKQPGIFFQIGAKPLFTVIPNTFMNDYILLAGGRNIAADLKNGLITRESVLARNPDIIIIVTMGLTGEEERKIWMNYTFLNASIQKKIYLIDSDLACLPTPVTFVQTLEEIIKMIHNEE